MHTLVGLKKTAKGLSAKDFATSDRLLDFRQGRKVLESKGLGWIIFDNTEVLAYFLPKSFRMKTLAEVERAIALNGAK